MKIDKFLDFELEGNDTDAFLKFYDDPNDEEPALVIHVDFNQIMLLAYEFDEYIKLINNPPKERLNQSKNRGMVGK